MFAIAGVTGNTGSVVAETLLAAKAPIRVIVRDAAKGAAWKARGAEVAIADLGDAAALTAAFAGVQGAYVLLPPRPTSTAPVADNHAVADAIAAAVAAAKVPHVVLLSSVGAQHPSGTGPIATVHYAEQVLAKVTTLTAVRAAYFMENWLGSLGALAQGILPTFTPAALAFPMVATRDIGRTAAAALLEGAKARQTIELAGPQDYAPTDVAAAIAAITGKAVAATEAPLDAVIPTFTSFGLSSAVAAQYREMYEGIFAGRVTWAGGDARAVRGTVTIAEVLRPALA